MSFPLVLLAGRGAGKRRDRSLENLRDYKAGGLGGHYKPLLDVSGRPLLDRILEAYTSSDETVPRFDPIYVAGPIARYANYFVERNGAAVRPIDTDGSLHENLGAVRKTLLENHPHALVTIAAGDVLPSRQDIDSLVDMIRRHDATADAIYSPIRKEAMDALGIEKRAYSMIDRDDVRIPYVFNQVYTVRPSQLRWDLLERGAKLVYARRAGGFKGDFGTVGVFSHLLATVLKPRNIRAAPFILTKLLPYVNRVRTGDLRITDAERAATMLLLYNDPRRKNARRFVLEMTDAATLGADIDTLTEKTATEHRLAKESRDRNP